MLRYLLCTLSLLLSAIVWAVTPVIIRTQPEGTLQTYLRSGKAFYPYYGDPTSGTQNGSVIDIVTAPDGYTIYMKNPISQAATSTWVKGTREGNSIHVPINQYVQYFDEHGYGWKTAILRLLNYDEAEGASYYLDTEATEITFSISADGKNITMDAISPEPSRDGYPSAMYALVYDDDYSFVGYADYESQYTPFNMTYTTLPQGYKPEMWTFTYSNSQPGETEQLPAVRVGNDVYLAGLSLHDPEAAIVGTVNGNDVTFPSDQYVGHHSGYLLYAFGATYEPKDYYEDGVLIYSTNIMTPQPALTMTLDAANHTLYADGQQALVLNMGKVGEVGINYMSVSLDPAFTLPETSGITHIRRPARPASAYDIQGHLLPSVSKHGITIINSKKILQP